MENHDETRAGDAEGGPSAASNNNLFVLVYDELVALAHQAMAREPRAHTLQPTALLNEAWLRLGRSSEQRFADREHFLAVAARAMRSVLVDHARRRGALKRGNGQKFDLDMALDLYQESSQDLLALNEALEELAQQDSRLARIVELRFFGGLSHPAIAEAIGVPLRSVERGWSNARAWLYMRIAENEGDKLLGDSP